MPDILQCRSETLLVETTSMTVVLVFLVVSLVSCVFVCCLLFCACSMMVLAIVVYGL